MTRRKVLEINDGMHLECIKLYAQSGEHQTNPYRLYVLYNAHDRYGYPAIHRKQIAAYGDLFSVVYMIHDMFRAAVNDSPASEIILWCKAYHNGSST